MFRFRCNANAINGRHRIYGNNSRQQREIERSTVSDANANAFNSSACQTAGVLVKLRDSCECSENQNNCQFNAILVGLQIWFENIK